MTFKRYGDSALLIELEQKIDPDINDKIFELTRALEKLPVGGIRFCIPAYSSLVIGFDPVKTSFSKLCENITNLSLHQKQKRQQRNITIPVCYEKDYAPDLEWLSQEKGIPPGELARIHYSTMYRVFMLGFLPGFAYMGLLPRQLQCERKPIPRKRVPVGSVGLAGLQTGIYPSESPGGWQIIGRTPLRLFDSEKEPHFLFQQGDLVIFQPISAEEFLKYEQA